MLTVGPLVLISSLVMTVAGPCTQLTEPIAYLTRQITWLAHEVTRLTCEITQLTWQITQLAWQTTQLAPQTRSLTMWFSRLGALVTVGTREFAAQALLSSRLTCGVAWPELSLRKADTYIH